VGSTEHDPPNSSDIDQEKPVLLTVDQAAERLGTTTRFIRRLRTERRIPIIKLGGHIRIDSNDLDAFIAAGRQDAEPRSS
jgi:excisionase family DNA binding protein